MSVDEPFGTLIALDEEEKRARVEVVPGVDIQIAIEGISHTIETSETTE